ncbi:MAG: tripartite tricarboxylate transporter substrate binding protein [Candidimonas sp.]
MFFKKIQWRACVMAGLATFAIQPHQASAQDYPSRAITVVLPYAPGSGTDTLARTMAEVITNRYNVPVVIDNKPGGNGFIAAQQVARAKPDGYTLFLTGNTTQSANEFFFKKLPYDPVKDFSPVALLMKGYSVLTTNNAFPAKTVQEFIDMAKASPGKFNIGYGTATSRIAAEMLAQYSGIKFELIPYTSNTPVMTDLLGGTIDLAFFDASMVVGQAKAGNLRALAATSKDRLKPLPDVPTLEEAGIKDYEWQWWLGMYLPAGASPEMVGRVNEMMRVASESEQVQKFYASMAGVSAFSSPEELARFQEDESKKTGDVVRSAGIEPQ